MSRTLLCSCGQRFSSSAEEGQTVRCPHCKAGIQVPRRDAPKRSGALKVAAPGQPSSERSNKRSLKKPRSWLRLLVWLLPVLACVVLIGLILTVPGLRRRVVVPPAPAPAEPQPAAVQPQPVAEQADLEVPEPPEPSLEPSEPGFEVLPPLLAQTPGRRVPKQLLVGRRAGMFASVEDAVAVAIPGDIIEIRTNQPMLVGGAVLRVKDKVPDAVLTIRAGKGYQPILRVAAAVNFLTVFNVDLTMVGIHFVASVPLNLAHPNGIFAANSNVTLNNCSFTAIPGTNSRLYLGIHNSKGIDNQLRVSLSYCYARGSNDGGLVVMSYQSPSVSVSFDESAIIGGKAIHWDSIADNQSISFHRCTLLCGAASISVREKDPANSLSFRMERCIHSAANLFKFEDYKVPVEFNTVEKREAAIRNRFREFKAGDSVARLKGKGSFFHPNLQNEPGNGQINLAVIGDLPQQDETMQLGNRVEEIRALQQKKVLANASELFDVLLPQDLTPSSTGFLGLRMSQGIRYGADLSKLPVPPPATLAPYHADYLAGTDGRGLKVRLQSEPFPLKPNGGSDTRQLLGQPTKPGQWADLLVPVPQAGKWSVRARLTRSPASGVVKFTINGEPAGKEVDLFAAEPSPLPVVELGEHTLPKGEVNLRIETVSSSPNAPKPGFHFGIERVVLRRVGKK